MLSQANNFVESVISQTRDRLHLPGFYIRLRVKGVLHSSAGPLVHNSTQAWSRMHQTASHITVGS